MHIFLVIVIISAIIIYNIIQSFILFLIPRRFRKKKEITGQRVLITGAGNGLGRRIAVEFSKHSTCLILLDIDKQALEETASLLDPSSRVLIYECDVRNREMVYTVAESIKSKVYDVDILVNNAGIVNGKSFIDLPDDKMVKTMEVNTISHFWTCKSFLPSMMARNKGHVVTIASVAGYTGGSKLTDYCASKYAAIGFTEALELELRSKNLNGIKFTTVCPAFISTGLFEGVRPPVDRLLDPKSVAEKIVEAVLEEKEAIFLPGYYLYLFMLKAIIPRWLWILINKLSYNLYVMETFEGKPKAGNASLNT